MCTEGGEYVDNKRKLTLRIHFFPLFSRHFYLHRVPTTARVSQFYNRRENVTDHVMRSFHFLLCR